MTRSYCSSLGKRYEEYDTRKSRTQGHTRDSEGFINVSRFDDEYDSEHLLYRYEYEYLNSRTSRRSRDTGPDPRCDYVYEEEILADDKQTLFLTLRGSLPPPHRAYQLSHIDETKFPNV